MAADIHDWSATLSDRWRREREQRDRDAERRQHEIEMARGARGNIVRAAYALPMPVQALWVS